MTDLPYPFVQSAVDLATARGPRKAVVWHFAEGGGTVGYLSRSNPNGVSVHFVIEYTGRIVQMLNLARMHTSIRVSAIRRTDDAPYDWRGRKVTYGVTARTAAMGDWGSTARTLGPNHASIGVEIEGFARNGPNDKQKDAMARLWVELRARYPGIRSIGHRDFADYKACPGKLIPWEEVGGHASSPTTAPEEPVRNFTLLYGLDGRLVTGSLLVRTSADGTTPHSYLRLKDGVLVKATGIVGKVKQAVKVRLTENITPKDVPGVDRRTGYLIGDDAAFLLESDVNFTPYPIKDNFNEGVVAAANAALATKR